MDILDEVDSLLGTTTTVPKEDKAKPAKKAAAPVDPSKAADIKHLKAFGFSGKRVPVIIDAGHEPVDKIPVFVRLNDYTCEIERGKRVDLPEEVVEQLENTVETTFTQPQSGVLIPHSHLRVPIRRVGVAS